MCTCMCMCSNYVCVYMFFLCSLSLSLQFALPTSSYSQSQLVPASHSSQVCSLKKLFWSPWAVNPLPSRGTTTTTAARGLRRTEVELAEWQEEYQSCSEEADVNWFKGKITGTPPYFMGKSLVSCRFSMIFP